MTNSDNKWNKSESISSKIRNKLEISTLINIILEILVLTIKRDEKDRKRKGSQIIPK